MGMDAPAFGSDVQMQSPKAVGLMSGNGKASAEEPAVDPAALLRDYQNWYHRNPAEFMSGNGKGVEHASAEESTNPNAGNIGALDSETTVLAYILSGPDVGQTIIDPPIGRALLNPSDGPKDVLSKMLLVRSLCTPPLVLHNNFQKIGGGACGTVFERQRTGVVAKRAHQDKFYICTEAINQKKIQAAFDDFLLFYSVGLPVNVPRYYDWVQRTSSWWDREGESMPLGTSPDRDMVISERIPSLAEPFREALIQVFYPESSKIIGLPVSENEACLVHPYLALPTRAAGGLPPLTRDFKFCVNEMLGLWPRPVVLGLARRMAAALAILHWQAVLDGRGIKFVLGGKPLSPDRLSIPNFVDWGINQLEVQMWVLNFDQCAFFNAHPKFCYGLKEAVDGFFESAYYPRRQVDLGMWIEWKEQYLTTSNLIIRGGLNMELPHLFIREVEMRM